MGALRPRAHTLGRVVLAAFALLATGAAATAAGAVESSGRADGSAARLSALTEATAGAVEPIEGDWRLEAFSGSGVLRIERTGPTAFTGRWVEVPPAGGCAVPPVFVELTGSGSTYSGSVTFLFAPPVCTVALGTTTITILGPDSASLCSRFPNALGGPPCATVTRVGPAQPSGPLQRCEGKNVWQKTPAERAQLRAEAEVWRELAHEWADLANQLDITAILSLLTFGGGETNQDAASVAQVVGAAAEEMQTVYEKALAKEASVHREWKDADRDARRAKQNRDSQRALIRRTERNLATTKNPAKVESLRKAIRQQKAELAKLERALKAADKRLASAVAAKTRLDKTIRQTTNRFNELVERFPALRTVLKGLGFLNLAQGTVATAMAVAAAMAGILERVAQPVAGCSASDTPLRSLADAMRRLAALELPTHATAKAGPLLDKPQARAVNALARSQASTLGYAAALEPLLAEGEGLQPKERKTARTYASRLAALLKQAAGQRAALVAAAGIGPAAVTEGALAYVETRGPSPMLLQTLADLDAPGDLVDAVRDAHASPPAVGTILDPAALAAPEALAGLEASLAEALRNLQYGADPLS